ncbi:hypothetical protein B5S31_g3337 [[Candida] boidinii]|nr:hypothetical protein B5S31_g3337 [[Candida] boidinii]OWB76683.1 hypothetical protein B5S32_g838 [[Candida] boidinii]GME68513.1 unnamed protein product [[Candida] boidinii]
MEQEEVDYSKLPLEERIVHKVWKARQGAYEELLKNFTNSPDENSECFQPFLRNPELLRKIVIDSNVVAQESGLNALLAFLEFGGTNACIKTRNSVVPSICEKGLSSSRAGTKQKSIDALLWYIELDTPNVIIELIIPSLSAKLPKLVSAATKALTDCYSSFGAKVITPKYAIDVIPKLFQHADRNVRAEALKLSVVIRSWMGESFDNIIFPSLKPVQQKDLTKEFAKIEGTPSAPRLLKSERERLEAAAAAAATSSSTNTNGDGTLDSDDVSMEDSNQVDAFDIIDPVNVLSKLPDDFSTRIGSSKWKDRVEVLEEVNEEFDVMKLANDDYTDFIRIMAKCMKDANVQVVTLAATITERMSKGLRNNFQRYVPIILLPTLERTKEKKASVSEALNSALDSFFVCSSFADIFEDTISCMNNKMPQVKIETSKYLIRCLQNTTQVPNKASIESIMAVSTKLLNDPQAPVRAAASEAIGTVMKIIGERAAKAYTENIDARHMSKINEFYEKAQVKAVAKPASSAPSQQQQQQQQRQPSKAPTSRPSMASRTGTASSAQSRLQAGKKPATTSSTSSSSSFGSRQHSLTSSGASSIPSKRGPTSPLKRLQPASSSTTSGLSSRSNLTARSLKANNMSQPAPTPEVSAISIAQKAELEQLREEKLKWLKEQEEYERLLQDHKIEKQRYIQEIDILSNKNEQIKSDYTNLNLSVKSKETQLIRTQNDLSMAKSKINELESELADLRQPGFSPVKPESGFKSFGNGHTNTNTNINNHNNSINGNNDINNNINNNINHASNNIQSHSSNIFGSPQPGARPLSSLQRANFHNSGLMKNQFDRPQSDLSTRVGGLSISSGELSPVDQKENKLSKDIYQIESNDEGWRRASEVTNMLKARIEKMKAKQRNSPDL